MGKDIEAKTLKAKEWEALKAYIGQEFKGVNYDALAVILSAYVSHFDFDSPPVWLFVLGASGGGKSSVSVSGLEFCPQVYNMAKLNASCFLSGYQKDNGILPRLTRESSGNGVLLFEDLTTFLELDPKQRSEVVGQLRSIYQGKFRREVGNQKQALYWQGKLSIIAAATNKLEKYWLLHQDLGERFLNVRWSISDVRGAVDHAIERTGKFTKRNDTLRRKIEDFVDVPSLKSGDISKKGLAKVLSPMAMLAGWSRTHVERDYFSPKREITGLVEREYPTRLGEQLTSIVLGSVSLFRQEKIERANILLGYSAMWDSVPLSRVRILRYILSQCSKVDKFSRLNSVPASFPSFKASELRSVSNLAKTTFKRVMEDLEVLEIVERLRFDDREYSFNVCQDYLDLFLELKGAAKNYKD